ncbi:hypothetical protein F5878DRAFT_396602 [Lentinula raphanica]|uniref:Uncharacterized protein n=1 Tax=Lentinula raphanica TaxID=153919 RepID=A0AA38UCS6_9AGAR|nr:hypothetical protein F5878DRAFT_396602 [Lentinula raphanica]
MRVEKLVELQLHLPLFTTLSLLIPALTLRPSLAPPPLSKRRITRASRFRDPIWYLKRLENIICLAFDGGMNQSRICSAPDQNEQVEGGSNPLPPESRARFNL